MWAFAVIAVAAMVLAPLLSQPLDEQRNLGPARARATAERMAVLRAAAVEWAHGHPGFNGPLEPAVVAPPSWWRGDPALHVVVQGRYVAVYVDGPAAQGVLLQMQRLSGGSIWVGRAHQASGTLYSPTLGDTGLPVPAAVPDNAPVWLGLR